jgi:hypothetical protein
MEEGPLSTQQDSTQQDEEVEDGDGDDVPQIQVTIVNEADLEGSFVTFKVIVDSDIS